MAKKPKKDIPKFKLFPHEDRKEEKVEKPQTITPPNNKDVVEAIKAIPKAERVDLLPIVKAVEAIPKVPQVDLSPLVEAIQDSQTEMDLEPLLGAIADLKDGRADARIVELADRFELSLLELAKRLPASVGGGRSASGKIQNSTGVEMNPATEEKQDDIITAIGTLDTSSVTTGTNEDGEAENITSVNNQLKVQDEHSYLLKEILINLKKLVMFNELLLEVEIDDNEVEE